MQQTTPLICSFLQHREFWKSCILFKRLSSSYKKMFPGKHFTAWPCDSQKDTRVVFKSLLNHIIVHDFQTCFLYPFFFSTLGPFLGSQENERNHCDQAGMHENHATPHRGQGTDPTTPYLCLPTPLPSGYVATLYPRSTHRLAQPLLSGLREHCCISWGHDVRPGRKCCVLGNSKIVWLH